MKPKKKSRRCRGLGLDSVLDLAISRFIYSFAPSMLSHTAKIDIFNCLFGCSYKKVSTNDFTVRPQLLLILEGAPYFIVAHLSVSAEMRCGGGCWSGRVIVCV